MIIPFSGHRIMIREEHFTPFYVYQLLAGMSSTYNYKNKDTDNRLYIIMLLLFHYLEQLSQ